VVVICPKCKTRLKVDDGKLKPEGSRFKCPKCGTFLLVKKPQQATESKPADNRKILVAHSNPNIVNEITSLLGKNGFRTITAADGIEAMVKTIKELPFLVIIEVSLPKIFGFEVCKRMKSRAETKDTRFILISSIYDKTRYKREPFSLHDADDYIEEHQIPELLIGKVTALKAGKPEKAEVKHEIKAEKPTASPVTESLPEEKAETRTLPVAETVQPGIDEKIERAKRLARTIISDIYLYNTPKADKAIRNDTFFADFAAEIREGLKLYDNRIAQDVRSRGDFFRDAINDFLHNKKKNF
jgi:predicted Zn finger-like uncharacterized protein